MAWPRFLTPDYEKDDSKDNGEWADVTVTSVVDGGHFWAQVGGKDIEEKLHSIRAVLENENVVILSHLIPRCQRIKAQEQDINLDRAILTEQLT